MESHYSLQKNMQIPWIRRLRYVKIGTKESTYDKLSDKKIY